MRVAIVHYWLVGMRGGEKVLEEFCRLYPQADIFTHVFVPEKTSALIKRHRITTTFIGRLPFAAKLYQKYLPLMPAALEELDLTGYDLVISSESGPAKGVITHPNAVHVCYCHSPMRYLWDQYQTYRGNAGRLTRLFMSLTMPPLRIWDVASAARVDCFVANSSFIARRIAKAYRRDATVIFPPVDIDAFTIAEAPRRDFYLCAGQLVPYKRVDLAVAACTRLGRRLVAMASGRPVIAYGSGGALDTVVEGETGVFFHEQTVDALQVAMERGERIENDFDPQRIRRHARGFSSEVFRDRFATFVETAVRDLSGRRRPADETSFARAAE